MFSNQKTKEIKTLTRRQSIIRKRLKAERALLKMVLNMPLKLREFYADIPAINKTGLTSAQKEELRFKVLTDKEILSFFESVIDKFDLYNVFSYCFSMSDNEHCIGALQL